MDVARHVGDYDGGRPHGLREGCRTNICVSHVHGGEPRRQASFMAPNGPSQGALRSAMAEAGLNSNTNKS